MLGRRFAIVTFSGSLGPWYRECVDYHGLSGRLAAIRCLDAPFSGPDTVQDELQDALVALCLRTAAEDEADVVILGGAPLAGLARLVAARVPVPLVDAVEAAVLQAEALVRLGVRKAVAGSFRQPAPKPAIGLPAALTGLLDGSGRR
jgi:Asp/Glu/hydantoin racemase